MLTRFAHDFRDINTYTEVDRYQMLRPEDIHQMVSGAKCFTKIDMRCSFMQIPCTEATSNLLGFWANGALYKFTRMPFGAVNCSAVYSRILQSETARAGLSHCCVSYCDDCLVFSDNPGLR